MVGMMKKLSLVLGDQELRMIEAIKSRRSITTTALLREALWFYHEKHFPIYKLEKIKKAEEVEKTPEQKCEELGGVLKTVNGIEVCEIGKLDEKGFGFVKQVPIGDL